MFHSLRNDPSGTMYKGRPHQSCKILLYSILNTVKPVVFSRIKAIAVIVYTTTKKHEPEMPNVSQKITCYTDR